MLGRQTTASQQSEGRVDGIDTGRPVHVSRGARTSQCRDRAGRHLVAAAIAGEFNLEVITSPQGTNYSLPADIRVSYCSRMAATTSTCCTEISTFRLPALVAIRCKGVTATIRSMAARAIT